MRFSISITGFVVLSGHTRVKDPHANFRNAFAGTSSNGNGIANALLKVNFAYEGYEVSYITDISEADSNTLQHRMPSMS